MKISYVEIDNYRSIKSQCFDVKDVLAFVGRNNSGKSNFLKAISLFFNPSTRDLGWEIFNKHDTSDRIRIRVKFTGLNAWEQSELQPWMIGDDFIMERHFEEVEENQYSVKTFAVVSLPEVEWLREDAVSGIKISDWWSDRNNLFVSGFDFSDYLGATKPSVGKWKECVAAFLREHGATVPHSEVLIENPKGYAGVLKGCLPNFIYVPAVRSVEEEEKVNKSNPFGQLVNAVIGQVSDENRGALNSALSTVSSLLNRGGEERIQTIQGFEDRLNRLMTEVFECEVEVEVEVPELEDVMKKTTLVVNDGWRTSIDEKGSGLQRSMIFTILRAYAELKQEQAEDERGGKSIIIAIEEPEIYLHPQQQADFYRTINNLASGSDQVFYTTHSPLFLEVARFDQICMVRKGGGGWL